MFKAVFSFMTATIILFFLGFTWLYFALSLTGGAN